MVVSVHYRQMNESLASFQVEILSDDEEEEEVIGISDDKYRPLSLDKMIALIALLVEKSRGDDKQLNLSERDFRSIIGGKVSPWTRAL